MKKIIALLSTLILTAGLLTGCGESQGIPIEEGVITNSGTEEAASSETSEADETTAVETQDASTAELLTGKHHVEIEVQDYGTIKLELDADIAPISVTNFVTLANDGFYNGLTFHRIMDGFMIQGGDPSGNGTGGSDTTIKGEFSQNGVENSISHVRGTISMARSNAMDSASSQFFIVQADSTFLDGAYAGFGSVTEGMDIVDQICLDAPVVDNNGTVEAENQPVITAITVID